MVAVPNEALTIAAFFDLENLAIGVREVKAGKFDVHLVLGRLLEKGNVVVKKAYADWQLHVGYKRPFHEAAIELIDIPGSKLGGKNSADIKMVVDALELSYTKPHIDAFALCTGDSDFSPLVSKLRENGKHVMGIGVKKSTSHLLIDNCDEFTFYDDLIEVPEKVVLPRLSGLPEKKREAFQQLLDAAAALQRNDKDLYSSLVKDTMKRKQPQFNEEYHGYSSFSRLLEDAAQHDLIKLRKDPRSGTYVIDEVLER
jgi:uncharacterized protein (TIGR00288 family)